MAGEHAHSNVTSETGQWKTYSTFQLYVGQGIYSKLIWQNDERYLLIKWKFQIGIKYVQRGGGECRFNYRHSEVVCLAQWISTKCMPGGCLTSQILRWNPPNVLNVLKGIRPIHDQCWWSIFWDSKYLIHSLIQTTPLEDYKGHFVKTTSFKGHFEIKDACRCTEIVTST